jgi:hypothetical protein
MTNENTGPLRKIWNKFKRGMSEINFILNITQTLVILWAAESFGQTFTNFYVFFTVAASGIIVAAVTVGGFAIRKVDPTMSILNPFAQDMVRQRKAISEGLFYLSIDKDENAMSSFLEARRLAEKWIE